MPGVFAPALLHVLVIGGTLGFLHDFDVGGDPSSDAERGTWMVEPHTNVALFSYILSIQGQRRR